LVIGSLITTGNVFSITLSNFHTFTLILYYSYRLFFVDVGAVSA